MANQPSHTPSSTDTLKSLISQWRKTVDAELKGASFEKKLVTKTPEEVALQPLYTRLDLEGIPDLESLPGELPFLRGTGNTEYKTNLWELCQDIADKDLAGFNASLLSALMHGQNSVSLVADRATLLGLDSDEAPEQACVGGLPLTDVAAFATALDKVALGAVPVHLSAGANALPLGALLLAYAAKAGVPGTALRGSLTADPLSAWAAAGSQPASVEELYDALACWVKQASSEAPGLKTVGVEARVWFEAGASATQELAFALATAVSHLRALQKRGIEPAQAAAAMRFSFAVGPQFFTEVAKFRAFRVLWSRVLSAFGCELVAAKSATHARTGLYNKTLHDPHVNLLRVTTEALSAVLGGCDSLHIGPYDEVTGQTDDFSRRIARNLHTLLAEEFCFAQVADPAGGSWYIEKLTDELARKAWALFQEIEKQGGLCAALRAGTPQKLVAATAAEKEDAVSKRRSGVVGTNLFPNLKETSLSSAVVDPALCASVAAAVAARRTADLGQVDGRAPGALLAAAAKGATVGQLSRLSLAGAAAGEQIQPLVFKRLTEGFEELRRASAAYAKKTGARPKVFLAKMGPVLQHKARADFSAGFFAVGGFESVGKQSFDNPEVAAAAAIASGASIVVLCSTDETYPELVPAFVKALKAAKPDIIAILAGIPAEKTLVEQYHAAGIDEFIHLRANVRDLLAQLLKKMGAL